MREKTSKAEIASVCQIRLMTGLPCERCTYNDKCTKYQKERNKENEQKKQRSNRRKGSKDFQSGSKEG
jgi:hypothetical protein